jgi:SPP1 gp7 family putative phage head morphogenesis protein
VVSKSVTLPATHPSVGLEAEYRKALDAAIAEMHRSLVWFLRSAYKRQEPEVSNFLAQDASPARYLNAVMRRLARRWQRKFDKLAPELAAFFAQKAEQRSTTALQSAMRKAGWTVKFTMSPAANDALQAVIGENVGLIKSIAQEHLSEVQGSLMRSVSRGGDLGAMVKELEARYAITRRRASLIARDQNNKANAVITRVRQLEVGITEAIWMHSHAGKHPRPSHVAADGKRYDIAKGCLIDGEWILPGQLINCRCTCRPVLPGLAGKISSERTPSQIRKLMAA